MYKAETIGLKKRRKKKDCQKLSNQDFKRLEGLALCKTKQNSSLNASIQRRREIDAPSKMTTLQ
jgi:hypothetical protein